jgi:hypothetical protein
MYLPVTFPLPMSRSTLAAVAAASVALAPLSLAQQSAVQGITLSQTGSSTVIVSGSTSAAPISVTTAPVQMMPAMTVGSATGGVVVLEDVELPEPPPEMLGAARGGPGAKASPKEEKPVDPKRVQSFQQAILDRTPSKILAEWSKAAPLTSAEDPELQDPPMPKEPAPKPRKPKAPKLQALERPMAPSELVAPVGSVADLAALAKAKQEAEEDHDAEDYAEALAAYQAAEVSDAELQSAYDADLAAYNASDEAHKAYKKEKSRVEKERKALATKRLTRDVQLFQRDVTLGRWEAVDAALDSLGKSGRQIYTQMLPKIARPPQPVNGRFNQYQEQCAFEFDDIIELMRIAPGGFTAADARMLAPLVARVFAQGHSIDDWVARLQMEVQRAPEERVVKPMFAAWLLSAQRQDIHLKPFLPPFTSALSNDNREALNLIARYRIALYKAELDPEVLDSAWEANLAVLAPGELKEDLKNEALKRAVQYAGLVGGEKGSRWIRETFTDRPDRGMEVLATIGTEASKGMVQRSSQPQDRLADLKLMREAVDSLLEVAPERAGEWRPTLVLLSDAWLREAAYSYENSEQSSMGPITRRDAYGNIYWEDTSYRYSSYNRPVNPIEPDDLLEVRPDGGWRAALPESLRPKVDQTIAELYLKVGEEKLAFPYIRDLAASNPKKANELARSFMDVWIQNNDPNASSNRSSIYNYSYGFNQRASGIPLTRSKQERNLKDLSEWVARLRAVEGVEVDSRLLVRAFIQSHSAAEIYRVEVMEQVFGDLETLDPQTLASMAQTMRANLATIWRSPEVQKNAGTNRKQKDIEAEVQRGYEIASAMLDGAIEAHVGAWQLEAARASLMHDLNNYRNKLQKSSDFAGGRRAALDLFGEAALHYIESVPDLKPSEYSTEVFDLWFNSALGATDLAAVNQETILVQKEIPLISDMLEDIGGEAAEAHRAMFANNLFTRLSQVNPACKNRFLEAGFEIVGDHPQAKAARRVYDYYADLVTEIELVTAVDGSADVGTEPFGIKVDIRYTKEIARESGGFAKYLQNQANAVNSYYNYGRPQENYRDKFEESVRATLGEQFDVISVTFNREDAASKADDEYGWRRTPYAYVLATARDAAVDRVPPLKLDLDFNDVTGYVVLPVTSPVVAIDASAGGGTRPHGNLQVTQILDERRADEGVLTLEVKAQANGLVPELDQIVDLAPEGFEVTKTEGQGVSVVRFADDEEAVVSERLWVVEMQAQDLAAAPTEFQFAAPLEAETQTVFQRYDDADLMTAEMVVQLGADYGGEGSRSAWPWLLLLALGGAAAWLMRPRGDGDLGPEASGLAVPDEITPVTVLSLLGEVRRANHMDAAVQRELDATVLEIERRYFGADEGAEIDLRTIAQQWVERN